MEVHITSDTETLSEDPSQTRKCFRSSVLQILALVPGRVKETYPLMDWFPLRYRLLFVHPCQTSRWGSVDVQGSSTHGHCFFLLFAVKSQYTYLGLLLYTKVLLACQYAKVLLAFQQAELHPLEHKAPLVIILMKAPLKSHTLTRFNLRL